MKIRKWKEKQINKADFCLNCDNKLDSNENYCPKCGQFNDTSRVLFTDLVRDILGYFFFYDFKLKNSLKLLLFKPGQLSIDLIEGKKVDYIHPIRLYFIVSLIFFAISSINEKYSQEDTEEDFVNISVNESDILDEEANETFYSIFGITDSTVVDSALIEDAKNSNYSLFSLLLIEQREGQLTKNKIFEKYNIENSITNNYIFNKSKEYSKVKINDFIDAFERKFNLVIFIFLPFFVIFLLLIHYGRTIYYYEHLIFAFNTQTALFLMLTFAEIVSVFSDYVGDILSNILTFIVFPIYLFVALKHFYKYKTYKKTALMFILVNSIFIIIAPVFFILSLIIMFFIY